MPILKYIERLQRIDRLIQMKATGTPEEFASKIGISRSTLMEYLSEMKELGGKITYCKFRQCYQYDDSSKLVIGFTKNVLNDRTQNLIKGGNNVFHEFEKVRIYRTDRNYLANAFR